MAEFAKKIGMAIGVPSDELINAYEQFKKDFLTAM